MGQAAGTTTSPSLAAPAAPAANYTPQPVGAWAQAPRPTHADSSFFIVLMSASPTQAQRVVQLLQPMLNGLQLAAGGSVNVLPIAMDPFGKGLGLTAQSNAYMLLLRNIIPQGDSVGLDQWNTYVASLPLQAWRLTPRTPLLGSGGGDTFPLPKVG